MGLIYVNPEGPNGKPDPLAAARDIRETFARMAMNDEETVALIAGGHTFGKTHGAATRQSMSVRSRKARRSKSRAWAGRKSFGTGKGGDAIGSGLEVTWTTTPTKWSNNFFDNLFKLRLGADQEPGRRASVDAEERRRRGHGAGCSRSVQAHAPTMLTTDLALRFDPVYEKISRRFHEHPGAVRRRVRPGLVQADASRHGSASRVISARWFRRKQLIWQDPIPAVDHALIDEKDVAALKAKILASGLSIPQLVSTAWASASTFRGSDKRGGANGARIRLAPQKDWEVNQPAELAKVLAKLEGIQKEFNARSGGEEGLAGRPDRSGRQRGGRRSCEEGRSRRKGSLHAGAHRCFAGADRCGLLRGAGAEGRRIPQLSAQAERNARRKNCWSTRRSC